MSPSSPTLNDSGVSATANQDECFLESTVNLEDLLLRGSYFQILNSSLARILLGHEKHTEVPLLSLEQPENAWVDFFQCLLGTSTTLRNIEVIRRSLVTIGVAALNAFLQSNVTGPPLHWPVATTLFSRHVCDESERLEKSRRILLASLTVDGEAIHSLTPHVGLFVLAKRILNQEKLVLNHGPYLWERLRVNFWHQRMLNDVSASLQESIYNDLLAVAQSILHGGPEVRARYFLERAAINMYFGFDVQAREDLAAAARETQFEFALTGRLGKRTKFQQDELSQLVVLAQSAPHFADEKRSSRKEALDDGIWPEARKGNPTNAQQPLNLNLDDDTLLEAISFSKEPTASTRDDVDIPESLSSIDPGNQPALQPIDSIILLATASSITNTSPQDGLTREETLPYATRVLQGDGINWQIYTQALLVRSRIEGYRSRTVERGVLQLQAVVDQVIAETTSSESTAQASDTTKDGTVPTTFLPRPKASESAPASERLLYIHQLAPPTRWKLEAELADRWVSLGGLRTALEIYERLQMWAEVALCWAASDREDEACKIIRHQLYEDSDPNGVTQQERASLPLDAPRLFCILGDLEKSPAAYQRAWDVSGNRYARAQRSLGKHYLAKNDLARAEEAYAQSLKINPQNHSTWFALGSVRLRSERWEGAVEAFGRAIQIEESDAESWSNLAAALLQLGPEISYRRTSKIYGEPAEDGNAEINDPPVAAPDPEKHVREAFVALKRAAVLKRESYRIWQNLLVVAAKLSPPPYIDIIIAQSRLIDLLGNIEGERCIDIEVVEGLIAHLIATSPSPNPSAQSSSPTDPASNGTPTPTPTSTSISTSSTDLQPSRKTGFSKMLINLIQKQITPLITTSRRLWLLTAKLSIYLHHPSAALSTYEKAWRATLNQPGWESGTKTAKAQWGEVVEATIDLVDAYESLGERAREAAGGMGLGGAGEPVCREWRFKARSALKRVLGRGREGWAGGVEGEGGVEGRNEGWSRLEKRLAELKRGLGET